MNKLELFDMYVEKLGWKVTVAGANSKKPVLNNWNKRFDKLGIRGRVEKNPTYNIGLCLGDIVDVEADTALANRLLDNLLGDHSHPKYKSRRSVHHLFLSPDPKLTRVTIQHIEFRGKLHQSLLPPSVVRDVQYEWLTADLDVPPMPDKLRKFYWRYVKKKINRVDRLFSNRIV